MSYLTHCPDPSAKELSWEVVHLVALLIRYLAYLMGNTVLG